MRWRTMLTGLAAMVPASAGVANTVLAQGVSDSMVPAPAPARTASQFFDGGGLRAVIALVQRVIPADDLGPGAMEADMPMFRHRQLIGAWEAPECRHLIRRRSSIQCARTSTRNRAASHLLATTPETSWPPACWLPWSDRAPRRTS